MSPLNPQQEQALEQVRKIMVEHFDSWILSYKMKNENMRSAVMHSWHGDAPDVLGLTVIAKEKVIDYIRSAGRVT